MPLWKFPELALALADMFDGVLVSWPLGHIQYDLRGEGTPALHGPFAQVPNLPPLAEATSFTCAALRQ